MSTRKDLGPGRLLRAAAALATGTLIVQVLLLLALWVGVYHPLPWHDEWDAVATWARVSEGDRSLAPWIAQHNEHRLVVPRVIWAIDTWGFGAQTLFTFFVIACLAGGTCLVYAREIAATRWHRTVKWLTTVGVFALVLCGQQASNLLWAFQVQWFLLYFFVVGSVAAMARMAVPQQAGDTSHAARWWGLAVALAVAANYSAASGNLVWGALAVVLIVERAHLPRWTWAATGSVGMLSVLAYARGFHLSGTGSGSVAKLVADPWLGPGFLTRMLGSPFAPLGAEAPAVAGVVFLLSAMVAGSGILRTKATTTSRLEAFCGGLLAFALAAALVTTVGRASLGLEGATESRLAAGMALGWASLLMLLVNRIATAVHTSPGVAPDNPATRELLVLPAVGVASVAGFAGAWFPPYDYSPVTTIKTEAVAAVVSGVEDRQVLERVGLYGRKADRDRVEALASHGWSIFANRGLLETFRGTASLDPTAPLGCDVVVTASELRPDAGATRVRGLVRATPPNPAGVESILLTDEQGRKVGAGAVVPQAAGLLRGRGAGTDWRGYVNGEPARLQAFGFVNGRWVPCAVARTSDERVLELASGAMRLTADAWAKPWLLFAPGQPRHVRSASGLAAPEGFGRWSVGSRVQIRFASPLPDAFRLVMVLGGFGPNVGRPLVVKLGSAAASVRVASDLLHMQEHTVTLTNPEGLDVLTFDIPAPTTPQALGIVTSDDRALGVAFQSLRIIPQ